MEFKRKLLFLKYELFNRLLPGPKDFFSQTFAPLLDKAVRASLEDSYDKGLPHEFKNNHLSIDRKSIRIAAFGTNDDWQVAAKADLYWTNWEGASPIIRQSGGHPWFAPPAADPDIYYPTGAVKDIDIIFIGGNYGIRKKLVSQLSRWFRIQSYGHGWPNGPVSHDEMISLFGRSKIVLGISGVGTSISVQTLKGRDFEVPMCGAAYLTSFNSEYARCFEVGKEVTCYGSVEDCVEIINWLLRDTGRIEMMGRIARERALKDHTWDKRVHDLLDIIYN